MSYSMDCGVYWCHVCNAEMVMDLPRSGEQFLWLKCRRCDAKRSFRAEPLYGKSADKPEKEVP